ncbi:hypothetical protein HanIR_Chr10g0495971 [Helianthus annuus]|nr:hypothetical protein HanIR_Chr10g0495971 [Helianthus annuus]
MMRYSLKEKKHGSLGTCSRLIITKQVGGNRFYSGGVASSGCSRRGGMCLAKREHSRNGGFDCGLNQQHY